MVLRTNDVFQSPLRWTRPIFLIGLALLIAVPCVLFGAFVFAQSASAQMAYALIPPEYPASQLKDRWQSGGPTTMWDRQTYRAMDSVDEVLVFYQKHFPGFTQAEIGIYGVGYFSEKCDESWLSRQIARLVNEGRYPWHTADNVPLPCVRISIYPAPDDSEETQYEIWLEWPAN